MNKILFILLILIVSTGCNLNQEITYKEITCSKMKSLVDDGAILIDVRTEAEYNTGYIEHAINMSSTTIMDNIENEISDKKTIIILYCKSGGRSKTIAKSLIDKGYKNVYDLGSINNCIDENIWIPN